MIRLLPFLRKDPLRIGIGTTAGGLMAVSADLSKVVDKAYQDKSLEELVNAPVAALAGISESGAKHLYEAFGVKTIGDLGRNKYFLSAAALAGLADNGN
jgi:hypothetical protein